MYYKAPEGHNCAYNDTISSGNICQDASKFLGLEYGYGLDGGEISDKRYPAGCFYGSEHGTSYFNRVIDPGEANPNYFSRNGGICSKTGQM